tara:strand:- start:1675 stop:1956 length:282 start_codon:yes stop_codon:yes gene_type:complete
MKIDLFGLPSPKVEKAKTVLFATAPRYQFFGDRLVSVSAVMQSQKSDRKYEAVIFQDPPEWFCECPDFKFRHSFCKHLSKLSTIKETIYHAKK